MSYETSRELARAGLQGVYEPDAELAAVVASVDACGTATKTHRYAWQRARDMQLRQRCIDKLMLLQAQDAAAFAATDEFEFDGSLSAAAGSGTTPR